MSTAPLRPLDWRATLVDLLGLLGAFVGVTVVKGRVLVYGMAIDPREIPMDDPGVYWVEYLTPVLMLPILT